MEFLPIETKVLTPPQDNLYAVLRATPMDLRERDIVLVTSKVVAIHQGRTILMSAAPPKRELVISEADHYIDGAERYMSSPLTLKYSALFYGAGIDESNGDGYYVLLPSDPFRAARDIHTFLCETHRLSQLGVVITDSHSLPLRRGCIGISIGVHGFHPVNSHKGRADLFGRVLQLSATNIADSLAAGSSAVCGEADEATPVTVVRGVPQVAFTNETVRGEILIDPKEDIYYPLLKPFYKSCN